MKTNNQLYGRLLALDRLQEETFNEINPNFSPVILVHGITGVGKTALCEHFTNLIRHQLIGVGETIIIAYKGFPQSSSTIAFSNLLLESIKRLRPGGIKMSRVDVQPHNSRLFSTASITEPSASELYGEDGAAYTDVLAVKTLSYCEEVELAQGLAQNLTDLLQKDYFMLGANARPRILFYFDQFPHYPENIKRWIGAGLYQAFESLKQSTVIQGSVYLQTGTLAWEQGDLADSWQVHPAALRQIELLRLSYSDCQEWLSEQGHTDRDLVDLLYEETEGVPARIKALLAQDDFMGTLTNLRQSRHADSLAQFSAKQRRWLHAAAMQAQCSREALQLLIGKGEAQDAIDWLQQDPTLIDRAYQTAKSTDEWSIRLNPKLRADVLHQAKKRKPLCHAGYKDKIELLHALNKQVPSRRHRDLLSQLSPIQPFSEKVLNEVFGR